MKSILPPDASRIELVQSSRPMVWTGWVGGNQWARRKFTSWADAPEMADIAATEAKAITEPSLSRFIVSSLSKPAPAILFLLPCLSVSRFDQTTLGNFCSKGWADRQTGPKTNVPAKNNVSGCRDPAQRMAPWIVPMPILNFRSKLQCPDHRRCRRMRCHSDRRIWSVRAQACW